MGFTSRAETLDPEDVEAILRPYYGRVREELERRGGTVEKFIGDAVMALFGAPVAHEDDPERAVRAALAIRDFATEDGLELRIGLTTGEALVSLDASPAEGQGMASGDVLNTAARLQSAAPVNGVIVDQATYRATRHTIDYRDPWPVEAKGKAEPVAVREALEARARFGSEVLDHVAGELVGRDRELAALLAAADRVRGERSPQLVTLFGVQGIGKSRLLYELSRALDEEPDLTTWHQGRCLAYGDGVTFLGARGDRQSSGRHSGGRGRRDDGREAPAGRGARGRSSRRGVGRRPPARPRLRGSAMGRRWAARLRRRARRLDHRGAAPRRLHGEAGAPLPATGLGRWQAQCLDDRPRAADRRGQR